MYPGTLNILQEVADNSTAETLSIACWLNNGQHKIDNAAASFWEGYKIVNVIQIR